MDPEELDLLAFMNILMNQTVLLLLSGQACASQVLPKPDYHIDIIRHLDDKRVVTLMGLEEV